MMSTTEIILAYVCPTLGSIMANAMFAAPVIDLRQALIHEKLGFLNPFPWAWGLTNCLGWTVYGFLRKDPFVVATNLPGLVLHVWLNSGASRLQYLEMSEARKERQAISRQWDASSPVDEIQDDDMIHAERDFDLVLVPQERLLIRLLSTWSIVLIYCAWFSREDPAKVVGYVVNVNLIVFYGAPLQTMQTVIETSNAESIHTPTMIMNWLNTSFWIAYGVAKHDPIIVFPNCIGLLLGLTQGVLKLFYPSLYIEPIPSEEESIMGNSQDESVGNRIT